MSCWTAIILPTPNDRNTAKRTEACPFQVMLLFFLITSCEENDKVHLLNWNRYNIHML